jgi:hypothetical protein
MNDKKHYLNELRLNCAKEQKKGLHFILTSILIWTMITFIHMTSLPILTKNLYTFCVTALLLPIAFFISKIIRVEFSNKENPLNNLGMLFSLNQMLYLLIAMWIYAAVPEKMVMVLAMIFGAHLLPYGWLYQSINYKIMSVIIPIVTLIIGSMYHASIVGVVMIFIEIIFSGLLIIEVKKMQFIKIVR